MKRFEFGKYKGHKMLLLIMIFVMALGFAGCGGEAADSSLNNGAEGGINVVATIFPAYDFAVNVAGDKAQVSMLLPPGAESHSFEPSPQDIIKIQNCDVFVMTGGESDKWLEDIISSLDTSNMKIVRMMDCVDLVQEEVIEGMTETDGHEGHSHEAEDTVMNGDEGEASEAGNVLGGLDIEYDEHVWTSPENAMKISEAIAEALCEADSENAGHYRENCGEYTAKLVDLSEEFRSITAEGARKVVVFGDRFPFRYFTDEYGLSYAAAFPGCSSETEPSVTTLTYLINYVKDNEIPVVFHIESSNHKTADMICESTGAKLSEFHSCHNLSAEDLANGEDYISLMKRNAENLREALK